MQVEVYKIYLHSCKHKYKFNLYSFMQSNETMYIYIYISDF